MKTKNEQIIDLLQLHLVSAHEELDTIVKLASEQSGHARTRSVVNMVDSLEEIARIEALIVRYS